jgi:hypothetical protein
MKGAIAGYAGAAVLPMANAIMKKFETKQKMLTMMCAVPVSEESSGIWEPFTPVLK